jgi:hypothetical protein
MSELGLEYDYVVAPVWKRVVAAVIDIGICILMMVLIVIALQPVIQSRVQTRIDAAPLDRAWDLAPSYEAQDQTQNSERLMFIIISLVVVTPAYHVVCETQWAATLGKRIVGLRVLDSRNLLPLTVKRSLQRIGLKACFNPYIVCFIPFGSPIISAVLFVISAILLVVDLVIMARSKQRIAWHDRLVCSVVVAKMSVTQSIPVLPRMISSVEAVTIDPPRSIPNSRKLLIS